MSEYLSRLVGRDRSTVPEVWLARASATPDAPFLRWNGADVSYADALERSLAASAALAERGFQPGDRVAAFLSNRPEMLWTWFGAQLGGGVFVALNREHRGDLLADMLARSGARLLVTEASALGDLPPSGEVGIDEPIVVDDEGPPGRAEPCLDARPGDLASILYSSGTTGRSKAVRIPHGQLTRGGARFAESIEQRPEDRWHAWMPMSHVFGVLHVTMATLVSGGSLALYPRFSVSRFWKEVHDDECTIFGGLGNMLRMLWHAADERERRYDGLRVGLIATPPQELRQPFADALGVDLVDSYGMTEAEPVTVPAPGMPPTSCGVANPDFEVAILDEDGHALPPGQRGEIAVRPRVPDVMFQGYDGDEAATVAAWRNLWFHTGDIGAVDERGFHYLLDRRKYVIRTRGENVSPSEVEGIVRTHPAVRDCAVVGVPSEGVDDDIKAVVVLEEGASLDAHQLAEFCHGRMAAFMVPRHVETRSELPYSSLGKVDREALA